VKENNVLNTVTASLDQSPITPTSLAARDEFGPITRSPGLFTASVVPVTVDEHDEFGPITRFVSDDDLL
jgi:hypothetical protein